MPKDVRPDDKERTGVQVLVWEPLIRNLVTVSIKEPSEAARFFAVEKAVRAFTNLDFSSENSAFPDYMMFAGSVSLPIGYSDIDMLVASTSGLKAKEDVAISVAILSEITGLSIIDVCKNIDNSGGCLPNWYHEENKVYFQFLFK